MLSTRAINILTTAGFDINNLEIARIKVKDALKSGLAIKWRNCGRKTRMELQRWVNKTTVENPAISDVMIEYGAISFLESKGYVIMRPNKENTRDASQQVKG